MFAFLALLAAAATPAAAPQPTKTIVIDQRRPCFAGRIGEAREFVARMEANQLARQLRKEGYKVKVVYLGAGMDRTMPDDSFRTFTAIC